MISPQEFIDEVSKRIDEGRFPAFDAESTTCYYRDVYGNNCFVGMLLPEEHPGLSFVGSVTALVKTYPEVQKLFIEGTNVEKMTEIQQVHDSYASSSGKERFKLYKDEILNNLKRILNI